MTDIIFHPGCRILVRGEEWQISQAQKKKVSGGGDVFEITAIGLTGIVRGQEFCFISCIDEIKLLNPADIEPVQDTSANAGCAKAYLEAHLRRLLPRNGALYLGQHGAVEAFPYQLEPAAKALHMIRPRIIIGDAVGVGKTIECGILLTELIRRGKGKRILCVVPKATLEQFQNEMWGRFSIGLHRLDSIGLQKLRQNLPSSMNPFYHFDKVIISLDTLKIESYSRLLKECNWDVVVVDEAHNVTNRTDGMAGSLRHKVAKTLSSRTRSLVLMSATPHDGTSLGFSSLVRLVDPTSISHDEKYDAESVKSCFIRRTRSQIKSQTGNQKPRKTYITEVPLTPSETSILQDLHDLKIEEEDNKSRLKNASHKGGKHRELFKTTLLKAYLSSPAALEETLTKKLKSVEPKSKEFAAYETILKKLQKSSETSSCLLALKKLLTSEKLTSESRVVVFTERLATLKSIVQFLLKEKLVKGTFDPTLQSQFEPTDSLVAVADGSLRERDLQAVVKAFQNVNSGVRILVASNVAAEGLNLHTTCHRLIHFDLPWSFITLEQRNGRIDRLGQKLTPEIHYLAAVAAGKELKNAKAIKDDFWVVSKLKARQALAAKDLDEEALSMGFVSGSDEEEFNTQAYESGEM
jgi:SNF2 family DNA or RNA helicase